MKNENLWWGISLDSKWKWNQPGNKEKQPNKIQQIPAQLLSFASLNRLPSCSSISVAMLEDYIILEWRVERRVKKTQVTADWLAQIFGISPAADYCNWADVFHVFSQGMYVKTMEKLEKTKNVLSESLILKPLVNDHLQ